MKQFHRLRQFDEDIGLRLAAPNCPSVIFRDGVVEGRDAASGRLQL
jgi:hypothetical protein